MAPSVLMVRASRPPDGGRRLVLTRRGCWAAYRDASPAPNTTFRSSAGPDEPGVEVLDLSAEPSYPTSTRDRPHRLIANLHAAAPALQSATSASRRGRHAQSHSPRAGSCGWLALRRQSDHQGSSCAVSVGTFAPERAGRPCICSRAFLNPAVPGLHSAIGGSIPLGHGRIRSALCVAASVRSQQREGAVPAPTP
jgi:hypothetical protein